MQWKVNKQESNTTIMVFVLAISKEWQTSAVQINETRSQESLIFCSLLTMVKGVLSELTTPMDNAYHQRS